MNISSKIARRYVRIGIPGFIILLLTACGSGGSANPTATSNTTPATGTSNTTITTPVLFVHGISSDNTNCYEYWPKAELYLQGKPGHPGPRFTGPMDTLGYYKGDMNCTHNLYAPGSDWYNKCQSYLDGTSQQDIGTNNDSIRHLACELAWYIYDTYSQHGTNVQLVAYSLGGLITRYALYAVQNSKYFTSFPKSLYVSDVVDFDTPQVALADLTHLHFVMKDIRCKQVTAL